MTDTACPDVLGWYAEEAQQILEAAGFSVCVQRTAPPRRRETRQGVLRVVRCVREENTVTLLVVDVQPPAKPESDKLGGKQPLGMV